MSDDYTLPELARNVGELRASLLDFERRWRTALSELHADNRGALGEINDSIREQSELLRQQNGRVTKLEAARRGVRRHIKRQEKAVITLVTRVDQMQAKAVAAATEGATQAVRDTAPSQKKNAQLTAIVTGLTSGGIIGAAYVAKMLFEAVQHMLPQLKP